MERLITGDIVVLPFPSFDLKSSKKRPALVLGVHPKGAVVCPITTKVFANSLQLSLKSTDFESGSLKTDSLILPLWFSTFQFSSFLYKAGHLKQEKIREVLSKILDFFKTNQA